MSPFMHGHSHVPPGFRFHPTDEELVGYYLYKKLSSEPIDLDIIREIDLYKMEPWDLQDKCATSSPEQTEWYFFSRKDKKYPTGTRTNRATGAGFWKATGRDKTIHTKFKLIGMRKTLVFYKGRAPNGQKTDWIMHEYRLEDEQNGCCIGGEDGWVVCRMFKKRAPQRCPESNSNMGSPYATSYEDPAPSNFMMNHSSSSNSTGSCMLHHNNSLNDMSHHHHQHHHHHPQHQHQQHHQHQHQHQHHHQQQPFAFRQSSSRPMAAVAGEYHRHPDPFSSQLPQLQSYELGNTNSSSSTSLLDIFQSRD